MSILKQSLHRFSQSRIFSGLVRFFEQQDDRRTNLLRVLTYHRVDELENRPHLCPGMISATPSAFRQQMQLLKSRYRVISLWSLLQAIESETPLPPRSVLVTFDDAYLDFAEQAWPILRELDLPATLFVPTSFPDKPARRFWWDRLYNVICRSESRIQVATPWNERVSLEPGDPRAHVLFKRWKNHLKSLPHEEAMQSVEEICRPVEERHESRTPESNGVLGWAELDQLAREGVVLAPHTQTHPLLNRVTPDVVRQEAVGSYRDLKSHWPKVPRVLAYPAGGVNRQAAEELRAAGFRLAFTTERGMNDLSRSNPLELRRINVGQKTSLSLFRAQLLPQFRHLARRFG